jgi:hypothetical protein
MVTGQNFGSPYRSRLKVIKRPAKWRAGTATNAYQLLDEIYYPATTVKRNVKFIIFN